MRATVGGAQSDFRLSLPRLLGFSTPGFCVGALAIALGVYLPRYYAGHFGLGLPLVGLAFSVIRVGDTLLDPLIGVWMDRTRSRLGRYRIWLALGVPVLLLGVYTLFEPTGGVGVGYLLFWLLIYFVGASLITLSHASWASVIAANYNERSRVFGAIQLMGVIGAAATLILPIAMAKHDGSGGRGDVPAMGWLVIISCAVGVALALMTTPEHVIADKGYDSDKLVETVEAAGAKAVIPPKSNRKNPRDYDKHLYKERNLVERFLNKVKNCRRVATRYEKTARNYLAFWQLASIMVLLA